GQLRDSESGLCYNRFRYYDPAGGGYISPDPIGVLGGESNYAYVQNPNTWVDPFGLAKCPSNKGFNRRDRITSRWTDRLTGKKPEDVHGYLTSKGWSKTYPQADKPGAIQHIQYVKTTKSGTTYKLDYHPGGSSTQPNIHGNDYWKVYRDVNGKDVVYGRIGHGGFKNYDLITDSPVYIDGVLMNGGL
ncbi:RHS repeat-associated core domain-containing protein, partial [Lonsdalea quercina]|uniref:RHS repeat-associated core domain-containing protein n=1 Tax=Lonsdalea quercina TaxID=71657 RepID=UPI00397704E1